MRLGDGHRSLEDAGVLLLFHAGQIRPEKTVWMFASRLGRRRAMEIPMRALLGCICFRCGVRSDAPPSRPLLSVERAGEHHYRGIGTHTGL